METPASARTTPRRATYQDLSALPENVTGELIDGVLYAMPRPRLRHSSTYSAMLADIGSAFGRRKPRGGPGGWIILGEPELHLGIPDADTLVLVPDIAGWRRERMPEVPDTAATALVPDWVGEILSPGRESHDRVRKMAAYGRVGVGWYWVVDVDQRSVEIYERDGALWRVRDGIVDIDQARILPFDEVEFDISEWWTGAPPEVMSVSEGGAPVS